MIIKASGRSSLILATGLFVCFAAPIQTAAGADDTGAKRAPRQLKTFTHHKSSRLAPSAAVPTARKPVLTEEGTASGAIPPSIANANALLGSAEVPAPGSAKAMTARASDILQATPPDALPATDDSQIVAEDQLNEVDRALHEGRLPMLTLASADAPAPAPAPAVVATSRSDNTTWDQTSLIGKIFIAFGGLLTVASAARMFMA